MFARGAPEPIRLVRTRKQADTLYDLLTAYSQQRIKRAGPKTYQVVRSPVYMIEEARERLGRTLGQLPEWAVLTRFLPLEWRIGERKRSAIASTFSACLEFARDGKIQLRQLAPFGEIFIKDRPVAEEMPS